MMTVLRGNVRTTPVSAMARSVLSDSGASGSAGGIWRVLATMERREGAWSARLFVAAEVVDHLAVVRELAGRAVGDLAAQLGHVADRRDDRLGVRRSVVAHLDVQRHPVGTLRIVDDEPRLEDLGMA